MNTQVSGSRANGGDATSIRLHAVAVDYDGTLAEHGRAEQPVLAALERLAESGRKLILVTGRRLSELLDIFPGVTLFDRVVAENGALLYRPKTGESRLLAPPPPQAFLDLLAEKKVAPLALGGCIVATAHPNEATVLEAIRELGLEWHVIFNKGAVMVLPSNVTKATGLKVALGELGLSPHEVVGLGDAENDFAFLDLAEFSAAVSSAVPMLKKVVDHVTEGGAGAGAIELAEELLRDDLQALCSRSQRWLNRSIVLGTGSDGNPVLFPPSGPRLMIVGSSGGGKSTLAFTLLEQLLTRGYQCCVIDPEGDYEGLHEYEELTADDRGIVELGNAKRAPSTEEVVAALAHPGTSIVANLLEIGMGERPDYLGGLLSAVQALRAKSARPHWLFIDEAHHTLPRGRPPPPMLTSADGYSVAYVTVHPQAVAPEVLKSIDVLAIVGASPAQSLQDYCQATAIPAPSLETIGGTDGKLSQGQAVLWWRDRQPLVFDIHEGTPLRRRHLRKYAQGELSPDRSFFFRGPHAALNLRAQNLSLFVQIADGIDDDTWLHHLRRGDYSQWFRDAIKDEELATEVHAIETQPALPADETRRRIRDAIERHYTLPAEAS